MEAEKISFSKLNREVAFIMEHQCLNPSEVIFTKKHIQKIYACMSQTFHSNAFLNWGIWNEALYKEYQELDFNFSKLSSVQDVYSQLLLYYLIKPLIKMQFFNKRLLDIGCGTGIGLKASSELLTTQYALGVDLAKNGINNANTHFYQENQINYMQSDAEHLPLENASFDVITNLESSHLYPRIESFFSEIARILAPGGFFCYADVYIGNKQQPEKMEQFIKTQSHLKIIAKENITKLVQASIYQRVIMKETQISEYAAQIFGTQQRTELQSLLFMAGIAFLPWWKIRLQNQELRNFVKYARKISFWSKKNYFYYLIQKVA